MYSEEDYLQLSGIQHFVFCERQWALIHIERMWIDNVFTSEGKLIHNNVDDGIKRETRKNITTLRSVPVSSSLLGLNGVIDVLEIQNDGNCVKYIPVEYKHGIPKQDDCDIIQVCAQAIALEEMKGITVEDGSIYYYGNRRRLNFKINQEFRKRTIEYAFKMHNLFEKGMTPLPNYHQHCISCSLYDLCTPNRHHSGVSKYVDMKTSGVL